jgi:orotate phosphoribosyltransferase
MEMQQSLLNLVESLYDTGVFQIDVKKGWELKLHETQPHAPLSPVFLNIRTPDNPKPGPVTPQLLAQMGNLLYQHTKVQGLKFNAIAGLPNAGDPIAAAVVAAARKEGLTIPLIRLKKEMRSNGTRRVVGVEDTAGVSISSVILVVDDLITEGHTKDEGINALLRHGYIVRDVLVVVDREQGGSKYLRRKDIALRYLLTLRKMVEILRKEKKISTAEAQTVLRYLKDASLQAVR